MDVGLTWGNGNSSAVSSLVEAVMRRVGLRPGVPSRLAWLPATGLAPRTTCVLRWSTSWRSSGAVSAPARTPGGRWALRRRR